METRKLEERKKKKDIMKIKKVAFVFYILHQAYPNIVNVDDVVISET